MSNFKKSSSRFSSRRFAIAIVLLAISTGAAEGRPNAKQQEKGFGGTGLCLVETFQNLLADIWLLATGEEIDDEFEGISLRSETDSEIEVDPPRVQPPPPPPQGLVTGNQRPVER
jgi:hypothetical protein